MFGLLRMAFTLLICVLAIGFYLGWLSFSKAPSDPQSNKVNINVSVDENKVRSDLQKAEQTLSQRIQDINTQPKGSANTLPLGQRPTAPRLNFGPISVQPSGQPALPAAGQPATPAWPPTPLSVQPSFPPAGPPNGQPAAPPQDYQFTVPLGVPPPGEGR